MRIAQWSFRNVMPVKHAGVNVLRCMNAVRPARDPCRDTRDDDAGREAGISVGTPTNPSHGTAALRAAPTF